MRISLHLVAALLIFTACGKSEDAGRQAAQQAADQEAARAKANNEVAEKISPPVPGRAKIPCAQLIDANLFQQALGEKDPITVKDETGTGNGGDQTASCSLMRGGKAVSQAEQQALIKKNGKIGVLPGDELCNVTAYCWTIEDPEHFKKKCADLKLKDDDSMGSYACLQVVQVGADDVNNYKFYDTDTKCLLQVRGGPGMVDNAFITTCAKAARDLIGPPQIAVGGAPAAPAPAAGSAGSGSAQ
jgi:hypothetical protein